MVVPKYKIAFDVNGSVYTVKAESVKVGNMFLQCFAETAQNNTAKVAYVPFDAVEYIVHESVTVSSDAPSTMIPIAE